MVDKTLSGLSGSATLPAGTQFVTSRPSAPDAATRVFDSVSPSALPAGPGGTSTTATNRVVTGPGPVTIAASDAGGSVFINKTANEPTTVTLLAGVPVTILDGKGDAATNNITIVPPADGKIVGQNSIVINGNYDALSFEPAPNSSNFGIK